MIYFTADTHFFSSKRHPESSLQVGERTFSTVEEKNAFLISRWNATVGPADDIYILGDLSDGSAQETDALLRQLNGQKYLIVGNNDHYLEDPAFPREHFVWVQQYYELLTLGTKFVLFHFPIEIWSGYRNDRVHLHGHTHREKPMYEPIRRYEVGVHAHDGWPVSLETIWEKVQPFHNSARFCAI